MDGNFSKFNDRLARPHRRAKRVRRLGDGRHRDEHVCNSPSVIQSQTLLCSFSSSDKDQQTESFCQFQQPLSDERAELSFETRYFYFSISFSFFSLLKRKTKNLQATLWPRNEIWIYFVIKLKVVSSFFVPFWYSVIYYHCTWCAWN